MYRRFDQLYQRWVREVLSPAQWPLLVQWNLTGVLASGFTVTAQQV